MERFSIPNGPDLIVREGDITKSEVDAIVNAANSRMLGGGGVDGAIHRAAGRQLVDACRAVPATGGERCPAGEARITPGFLLPANHVIHTVGPIYRSEEVSGPVLRSAYESSLVLARAKGLKTIAFPAISCGVYGYPHGDAAAIAVRACRDFGAGLDEIHLVLFGDAMYRTFVEAARAELA